MRALLKNSKGVALTVVFVVLVMLTLLSALIMSLGYNRKRLITLQGLQVKTYYLARGGVVDAYWRLQNNIGPPPAVPPSTGFFDDPTVTLAYDLDVDGDGRNDTHVSISDRNGGTQRRTVSANDI